jgi:hypothetical protein
MSKMDELRAMREQRYEQRTSGSATRATAPKPLARPTSAAPAAAPDPVAEPTGDALCGHRSMNGRTCTREHGHSAKSHRYS